MTDIKETPTKPLIPRGPDFTSESPVKGNEAPRIPVVDPHKQEVHEIPISTEQEEDKAPVATPA